MPIKWTKPQRARLSAIRHPHPRDPQPLAPTPEAGWAALREQRTAAAAEGRTLAADPSLRPLLDALLADLDDPAVPALRDPAHESCRAALCLLGGHAENTPLVTAALIALWSSGGPALPVQLGAATAPCSYRITHDFSATPAAIELKLEPPGAPDTLAGAVPLHAGPFRASYLRALRSWLFRLPDADFRAARDAAAPIREALLAERKTRALASRWAWAFARDPSWADADVDAILERRLKEYDGPLLLASLTDPERALALAKKCSRARIAHEFIPVAYDVIEALGDRALEVLEAIYTSPGAKFMDSQQRRRFEEAIKLALTAHPEKAPPRLGVRRRR